MPGFLSNLVELYRKQLEKHRNRLFLEAAMAACALIATVEGNVTFRHRVRIDQLLETLEALKVFDPHEGVNLFNEYVETIQDAPREGHEAAMQVILKETEEHPEKAELLIRICLAVSEVDGVIPMTEQIEIAALCNRLGVDPGHLGIATEHLADTPEKGKS